MIANYVYIMYCPRYFWLFKLGFSNDPKTRAQYIEKSMNNKYRVYIICSNRMYFALTYELLFHSLFYVFNYRISKNISGFTEWYVLPILPIAVIWVLLPELVNMVFLVGLLYIFCK